MGIADGKGCPEMKLAQWRRASGKSQLQVAEAIGSTAASIARYEAGTRIPEAGAMRALYLLTHGAVRPDDFYDLPDLNERVAA